MLRRAGDEMSNWNSDDYESVKFLSTSTSKVCRRCLVTCRVQSVNSRDPGNDGGSLACATGYPSAAQQGTIASFLPLLDAKRPISSGSLVRIRSPERATRTTVASIGSSVRDLARSAPASRPIFSSTGRTSTARRSLATPACLPPGLRHTCRGHGRQR